MLSRRFRLGRTDEVATDYNILLNHTFTGEDDVSWAQDAGFPTDLVPGFLKGEASGRGSRKPRAKRVGWCTYSLDVFSSD